MTTVLIGHRGVGKSALLKRIKSYLDCEVLDLDSEIEKLKGKTISEIFQEAGESGFRKIEKETLFRILQTPSPRRFMALGAGLDTSFLHGLNVNVLWVRRKTDSQGRMFLNRPLLNPGFTPFEDYMSRYADREKAYKAIYKECLILPEGLDFESPWEKAYFTNTVDASGASLSLLPRYFFYLESYLKKRESWNLGFVEFRDDLLAPSDLVALMDFKDRFKILYSFRKDPQYFESVFELGLHYDWPLEWGLPPQPVDFLSLHELPEKDFWGQLEFLKNLPPQSSKIKFAPEVLTFEELRAGHRWVLENPQTNIFLPRGRLWHWYRLFMKGKYALNFIREDDGTSSEQPTLLQWLMTPAFTSQFSAVLGDPVVHSRSPVEHSELGAFFDIQVKKEEWDLALDVLKELGLQKAAITSPLKELAGGVNTLQISSVESKANTDIPALRASMPDFLDEQVVVWGGGGTLPAIEDLVPQAVYYSAREGKPREGNEIKPDVVIWAAGRSSELKTPPPSWRPRVVYDLNYTENSPGLEFAIQSGAEYVSGLEFFKEQARLQKEFWK